MDLFKAISDSFGSIAPKRDEPQMTPFNAVSKAFNAVVPKPKTIEEAKAEIAARTGPKARLMPNGTYAPSVSVMDVVRELPGAAAGVGQAIAAGGLRFGYSGAKALTNLVSPDAAERAFKPRVIPGLEFLGEIEPYQDATARRISQGEGPVSAALKEGGMAVLDEPLGMAFKPVFLAGSLLLKGGAKKFIDDGIEQLAKIDVVDDAVKYLKNIFEGTDDELKAVAPRFVEAKTPDEVKTVIKEIVEESKPAAAKAAEMRPRGLEESVIANEGKFRPDVRAALSPSRYETITNKATLEEADALLKADPIAARDMIFSPGNPTPLSNTVALRSLEDIQSKMDMLDRSTVEYKTLLRETQSIIEETARKATEAGQTVQALRMWSKSTPEGALLTAQRIIDKANAKLPDGKKLKLGDKDAADIMDQARKVKGMKDGEAKDVETAVLMRKIAELVPASLAKKIAIVQTMAQLLNPKTAVRNVVGNAGFAAAENVSDVVGTVFDSALSLITKKRTTSLPSLRAQIGGFRTGLSKGIRDARLGINTAPGTTQFDLPQTAAFKGGVGAKLEKTLNMVLRGTDRAFFQAAYEGSLAKQMRAAKVDVPTEAMKEEAVFDGMYRTFQDDNAMTKLFSTLKKGFNYIGIEGSDGARFGLGDFILKYPKTPANLLNRGLAYSPAGFFRAVMEFAQPLMGKQFNQKRAVEALSRATVGTAGAFGVGASLYKLGIITSKREERSDVANVKDKSGFGQYRANLSALKRFVLSGFDPEEAKAQKGDVIASYDWMQPGAMSIALGADFEANEGSAVSALGTVINGVKSGIDTLAEQPLVSGIANVTKYGLAEGAVRTLEGMPASFVPTLLNQVRQLVDNDKKNVYSPDGVTYALNLVKNRVPGLSQTLEPKVDVFGEDMELYQDGSNNLFNVFFNPSFVSKYKLTPEAKLVVDLFNETGDTRQIPNVVRNSQTVNKEQIDLTPAQVTKMQRYIGTVSREVIASYAEDPRFRALPYDRQVSEISSTLSAIGSAAKVVILKDKPERMSSKTKALVSRYVQANKRR